MSGMKLVTLFITVCFGCFKVLNEAAAEIQTDELHALADAEHRLLFFDKKIQKGKLLSVQYGIDVMAARVGGRLVGQKIRIDIAAARKDERIPMGGAPGRKGNLDFGSMAVL